jgi:hypothetical protein
MRRICRISDWVSGRRVQGDVIDVDSGPADVVEEVRMEVLKNATLANKVEPAT